MPEFVFASYSELRKSLESGNTSVKAVVQSYLTRIKNHQSINAFIEVFEESALKQAERLDQKLAEGKPLGKLFGMPMAIKDNIAIKNKKLTCASKILSEFNSIYDATVIERIEAEDVVILGKLNMDEFAMGSSTENSFFGPTKNPVDQTKVPGGSSGGSAAAVSADCAMVALGSDTGGSVRQPASFCNVVGLKPTYGRVSRYGLVAFASSFDQIGVLAKNSEDAARVLEVIAGEDPKDSTSGDADVQNYANAISKFTMNGLKIGVPKEFFTDALDEGIKSIINEKLEALKTQGAELVEISLPYSKYALATYYILANAEASSNLSRYDGARYGYRSQAHPDLEEMYVNSRSEGFGDEVKRRIMLGTYVLSAGYYDAYYKKAQQVRRLIRDDYLSAFESIDVIAGPTSPIPPFTLGEKLDDPLAMYLADIYTVTANLSGVPAISVPAGFTSQNMPVGMQIIGKPYDEATILGVSQKLQALN